MNLADGSKLACAPLLRLGVAGPSLVGSRCTNCGEVYFAAGRGCTRCCSTALEPVEIGSQGWLWSWTIQGFLPKSPYNSGETEADFQPYGVGYVEMPSGVKVESRLTVADPEALRIGMPMELTLFSYGTDAEGQRLVTFAFAPAAASPGEQHE
jgi:uncharacterized OB-fold protein